MSKVYSPADVVIAYQKMAMTEEGQVVLHDLVRKFGFAQQSIAVVAAFDPVKMQVMEGQRSVCAYIGTMLETDPSMVENAGTTQHDEYQELDGDDEHDFW